MIQKSFLFNNVRVKLVPHHGQDTHPGTGIAFYVNNGNGGVIGVRVYPDGRKELCNATPNKQGKKYGHGTETYLQFKHAWKTDENILVSHAVYIAWRNKEIPAGMTIDHVDGCTTNNDVRNLRCVSGAINSRDGGFLTKLRNQGINPPDIQRPYLLRYFYRMAHIKANISSRRYDHLDRADLMTILFYDIPVVYDHFKKNTKSNSPSKWGYFNQLFIMPNDIKKLRRLMTAANHLRKENPVILCGNPITPSQALKYAWWFEDFRKKLSTGVWCFSYFKKDGHIREAVGTLDPELIPDDYKPKNGMDPNAVAPASTFRYYDLLADGDVTALHVTGAWRSFRIDNFIGFVEEVKA